jgi:hypothetical protein
VHLAGIAMYLFASVLLWRTVRTTLGRAPAVLGLAVLLFLPSLYAWSISALKEPLYFLMTACSISWSITIVRDRRWVVRVAALLGVIASVAALQTIREQGGVLTGAGLIAGVAMAWLVSRPRVLVAVAVALPIVVGASLRTPAAQIRAYGYVKAAAKTHWGHVETKGWVYTLLDPRFYKDSGVIEDMQFRDVGQFVVGAVERYVTVPWPWEVQSTAALADLPEQVIWYFLIALFPIGLVFSLRRDVVLTGLFAGVALVAAAAIAFLSGNVGTLVRLRVLAIPYVASLSMVGLCELLARAARAGRPPSEKAELTWP